MSPEEFSTALLDWYTDHARELPWRIGPRLRKAGHRPDPYRVWLSEIMLQQTTIAHGTRYFLAFTARWPSVQDLAAADEGEVMAAWAGLGYYARARNLLKCAREVSSAGGEFPETEAELRRLPGIGPYTAGAIAAIAFDRPAAAVDGNVERVMARILALEGDWAAQKKTIRQAVEVRVSPSRPGEFAEGLMDLGATVCTPKRPNCLICPVKAGCNALKSGAPERYPIKPKRAATPARSGSVAILQRDGRIALERRPGEGLLGGMLGLPGSVWKEAAPTGAPDLFAGAPQRMGTVRHVFTHFSLTLEVWSGAPRADLIEAYEWHAPPEAMNALPSVFAKAVRLLA